MRAEVALPSSGWLPIQISVLVAVFLTAVFGVPFNCPSTIHVPRRPPIQSTLHELNMLSNFSSRLAGRGTSRTASC
ncbi:hypothetical protein B0H17DRAFT_14882 [Mycena rosella]|uniref:Uncharacterized protein n=1 Tax=Mycena rosella TaxID=1033263 RepID=A0AAD7D900_MYCRO|nr:hypothetical protein B0H17DRAFT_14882 [Mycena rosella]